MYSTYNVMYLLTCRVVRRVDAAMSLSLCDNDFSPCDAAFCSCLVDRDCAAVRFTRAVALALKVDVTERG